MSYGKTLSAHCAAEALITQALKTYASMKQVIS